jgi:hypothetical protein
VFPVGFNKRLIKRVFFTVNIDLYMENLKNFSIYLSNDYDKCTFTNGILIRYFGTSIFFIGILSTLLSIYVFTRKPLRMLYEIFSFLNEKESFFFFLI